MSKPSQPQLQQEPTSGHRTNASVAAVLALTLSLGLAWANFLGTTRWADVAGALHGWKEPWYLAALTLTTLLAFVHRRRLGLAVNPGRLGPIVFLTVGAGVLLWSLFSRLPPSAWTLTPFDDDWTPLFQAAVNGVHLLQEGVVMGWNWSFLGGYPASADIAQSFALHALLPMSLFGERVGFHLLVFVWFLSVPIYVWWDLRSEDRTTAIIAAGLACFMTASYSVTLGKSGDVNSLAGVFSAGLAMVGSREARRGRWWGGPLLILGLTLALYSHVAFFVYAGIYVVLEAVYFRDRSAAVRAAAAGMIAVVAALPVHWESLRFSEYVSSNNVVYSPGAPINWATVARTIYYNVEILAFPHRWFNDYRSLVNVWSPVVLIVALLPGRTRVSFYAWAALVSHALLRLNAGEFGAGFDRIMHMLPMLAAPALAGFLMRCVGSRVLAASVAVTIGLYCAVSFSPVPHVSSVREFEPALIDRLATLDGPLVLFEISPHRDMDSDPVRRTPKATWNVHFEGLLPGVAGQRFYGQMWDGWVWSIWRGQVVGAGSFAGQAISDTPHDVFVEELRHWGVRHLVVWTDASRTYFGADGRFVERWRDGVWSHFELTDADVRTVTTERGTGDLENLDPLGADVTLSGVAAGDKVVVRTNFYPAWQARVGNRVVPLYDSGGQLAFDAPSDGDYVVRLEYPKRRGLSLFALCALLIGMLAMARTNR